MTELELPHNNYDLVFSNWLLMYLSDKEVAKLANTLLSWVSCLICYGVYEIEITY